MAIHTCTTGTHVRERSRLPYASPAALNRLIAPGGPVSAAIQAMRQANDLPPILACQFASEADEIQALRETIRAQLRADLDRVDRCLVILDAIDGDADIERDAGEEPEGVMHAASPGATEDDEYDSRDLRLPGEWSGNGVDAVFIGRPL